MLSWSRLAVALVLVAECAFAQPAEVPMRSGGVGSESREEMKAIAADTGFKARIRLEVRQLRPMSSRGARGSGPILGGAHETLPRPLQLLRRQRQLSKLVARHRVREAILVQMALPSESTQASHVGAVRGFTSRLPTPRSSDHGSDLGFVATSHISGGAGWWKSPCPDLERAQGGCLPRATRQLRSGSTPEYGR